MVEKWSDSFRYWMFTLMTLAVLGLIWYARPMMQPLLVGALVAYLINPLVDFLERRVGLRRSWAATLVLLLSVAVLAILPALTLPTLVNEVISIYSDLEGFLVEVQGFLSRPVTILDWQIDLRDFTPDIPRLVADSIGAVTENAFRFLEGLTKNVMLILVSAATTYCLVREWDQIRDGILGLAPEAYRSDVERIYEEIKGIWRGYVRGNMALMLIAGVLFTIAWVAIGVPGAFLLGVIAGLLTIIPDVGPAIAAGLAALVALLEGSTYLPISNLWFVVLVIGVYMVIINVKTIWIRPRVFGRSVHMHEGVVFVAIIAAVILQGILGAIVVVPVLGSMGVIGRYTYRKIQGLPGWPEELAPEPDGEAETPVEGEVLKTGGS